MEGRRIVSPVQEKYKDVFLSHSGRQKNFVEQLYRDLTTENVSPFLDKDPQSLPKGRPFPSRILSNARNCKVAVLVLSPDFLSSAWPMFELSAIVNAQRFFNPDMAILPLFFKITVKTLREKLNNHDLLSKWKKLQAKNDRVNCEEWHQALKEIFKFNGMEYSEDEGEVAYRDRIVDQIRRLLPPNLKYEDSLVQGNTRLCQEVANLFEKAEWRNGVKVVGLYGIAGSGKTTVCESLCNFYSRKFKGKVFHAELQNDLTICIETQKRALKLSFRELSPRLSYNRELFANVAVLHLESVRQLTSLNLSSMKVLKSFSVRNCEEITEIQGIEHLPNIAYLALVGCNPLLKAPQIEGLTSLRWFRWGRREKPQLITRFGDLRKCQSLETLSIRCESLREYPKLGGLPNLRKIGFSDCSIVMNVPNPTACSTVSSAMTARLSLTEYSSMVTAPDLSGCLQFQFARLDGCSALTTGPSFSGFSQLQKSWLNGRSAMITAPDLSGCSQLQTAHFQGCSALATGPNFSGFSQLRKVSFNGCSAMITAPDLGGCSQLQIAYFDGCSALITGPNFSRFSQLREVRFNGCSAMTIPPDLSGCSQLQIAYFDGCSALAAGPNFSGFSRLRDVRFNGCSAMITAPDLGGCSQLQIAYFDGCYALATGPNFSGLSKLQEVRFKGCSAMNTAPNIRGCSQLQIAHFGGCSALATGPNFSGFSQLRKVSFNGCSAMITAPNLSGCSQLQFADFRGCSALAIGPNLVSPRSTKEFGSTDALL